MNEIIQRPFTPQSRVTGEDPLAELARIVAARPGDYRSGDHRADGHQAGQGRHEPQFAEEAPAYDAYADEADHWQDEDAYAAHESAEEGDLADDELYDDTELHQPFAADERVAAPPPRGSRVGGLAAIAALLLMAVAGGGAALAWKSGLMSGVALPGAGGPPPVIQASSEPVKITPPPAATDDGSAAAKEIFNRAGQASGNEKVVSREEQPMAVPSAPTPSAQTGSPKLSSMQDGNDTAKQVASTESIDLTGPRKVKTIKILADGRTATDIVPVRRASVSAVSMPQADDAAPVQMAGLDPAPTPDADATPDQAPDAAPTPAARPLARPKLAAKPAAKPASKPADAAPAAKPVQVASLTDDQPAAGGGFVVQIASQKSEADATSTFQRLQSKYSGVLGGMKPSIRRADLGDKGTFYRIRVGPMASRDEAVNLCVKLKAAGGSCVVARN